MMRNIHSPKKIYFFIIMLLTLLAGTGNKLMGQAVGDYGTRYITGTSTWDIATNWIVCTTAGTWTGATVASAVPTNTKNVWIRAGSIYTMNYNPGACNTLTISGELTWPNRTFTLSVSGNLVISGGIVSGKNKSGIINVAGNFTVPSGTTADIERITFNITGTTAISGTVNYVTNFDGTKTFIGMVTINPGGIWNNTINEGFNFRGGFTNNGTVTAGTGLYLFNTNNQIIGGTVAISIPNLTVTGVTLTNNNTLSVTTALGGTGGLTQAANATLNIGGTSAITTLTAIGNGNTVNYNGLVTQTVNATSYYNLSLSGSLAKTLPIGLTSIINDLTLSGTATTVTTVGLTIGGNLSIGNGTTFTAAGFPLNVTGTTNVGGGTSGSLIISSATGTKIFTGLVTDNAGATWNNSGSSPITFRGGITNNATFNAGTGVQTFDTNNQALTGIFSIPNITITGVTLTNNNTLTVSTTLAGNGNLTQATNSTLNIGGTSIITTLTAGSVGNTVNYTGAAQIINGNNYYHLNLSGSAAKTMPVIPITVAGNFSTAGSVSANAGANISFNGNVTLGSGSTFNAGIYSHTVGGNWINNGAIFSPSSSSVTFNGNASQSIGGTTSTTFYILGINNAAGITLNRAINTTSLVLNNGKVTTTATNLLTVTGSSPDDISGNFSSSYINGPLARTLPPGVVNVSYLFPVGKSGYNPLSLINANTTSGGNVVILGEVFDANCGGSAGVGLSLLNTNRYWNATITSGTSFLNSQIQLTETLLVIENAIGESITKTGAYDRISNDSPVGSTITSDPVTSLGYFAIGEKPELSIVATSNGTEGGSNGLFTITTSKQFTIPRTVTLSIGGTATNGTDYTTINTTVTFPAFQTTITIPVTVTNDLSVEPTETVIATIVAGVGYAVGTPSMATVNIIDNDIAGITVNLTSGLVTTEAGGTATFTMVLNTQPTANVNIGISSNDVTEGTVTTSTIIFTTINWNIPQTIIVTGQDDFVQDGNISYSIVTAPSTSADINYINIDASDVTFTNTDNDVAGITVNPTSGLSTTEAGGTAALTIVLKSQPTADVTLALSSGDTTEGTVSTSSVTFTSANWNVAQTVMVTGVDDYMIDGNITYNIVTSAATSGDTNYNSYNPSDVSVTNIDNDVAGVTVTPVSGLVTSEASGGSATFTIVLNSQPSSGVTISITSDDTTEGTVSLSTVTFTNGNWNIVQTITVTGVDDFLDDGNIVYHINTGAAVSSDLNYSGLFAKVVTVTNNDNDIAGISVNPTSLTTTETSGIGQTKTFTVVLNTLPTASVSIGLSSGNINEGTVSPSSLTFTTSNWSTPQTVTVIGVDDSVDDGDQVFTIVTAAATGGDYAGINAADVTVTNLDDDAAGITVFPTSGLTTTEGGGAATFTIKLNSQPTANVSIGVSSGDITEGTVSPASVTFTSANWNLTQTITVTGVNDDVQDGNISYSVLTAQASSTDPLYSVINPSDVTLTNSDNDIAGFTVSPVSGLTTSEAGGQATFTIRLTSAPTANVTVNLVSNDLGEGTVSPATVTFTPLNWSTNQTVTVTGVNDFEMDGNIIYSIITTVPAGGDAIYNAINPSDVTLTNIDNDVAGITVNPLIGLITTEGGGTATFTIKLNSQPTGSVTFGLSSSNVNEGTVLPATLIFTVGNWNTPQTVTVTGVNDFVQDGNIAYSIVTAPALSTDGNYNNMNASDVSVTNTDNDVAGITVNPSGGLITDEAGGTANFSIVLTSQPTANVVIGISSGDLTEGTVSPSSLTFTSVNWNIARTVTITGANDFDIDGNVGYTIITAAATSSDGIYNGMNPSDVSVINNDNDVAGITIVPTSGLNVGEDGSSATFTIVLNTNITANVTIGLLSNDLTEGTVLPALVTFTNGNWNLPQTITVTGVDDIVDDGNINFSIVTAAASSGDSHYNGLNPSDVSVININNDVAGITVVPISGLTTTEAGGTAIFSIKLNTQPIANVTVNISSDDLTEGTVSPTSIIFTSANWNTPVNVTITGKDDNDIDGDVIYHILSTSTSISDTKYNGLTGENVTVTNTDNDTPGITVSPLIGLFTTEAGGTATFTVALITKPKNPVTIDLSSSNITEGNVSPLQLSFTGGPSGNWATPQTVTVTGVNDALADGDISYSIILQFTSDDVDYDRIDPYIVDITNIDLTPTISSFTPVDVCYGSGTLVVIHGTFFTGATSVRINGVNTIFTVNSPTQITATLPANATSGTISIVTPTGTAVSSSMLTVITPSTSVAGTAISTCSNMGAINITAGSSATNYSAVAWTSSGSGTFANASSLTTATYTPSMSDITTGSVVLTLTAIGNSPCGNLASTKTLTITTLPVATITYSGTPFCKSVAVGQAVNRTGTAGGTYSALPAGLTIDSGTGAILPSTSTVGNYTVTYTMAGLGGCTVQTTSCLVSISPNPIIANKTASACSGTIFTVSPTNGTDIVPSGTTYSWSAPVVAGITGTLAGINAASITGTLINTTNAAINVTYTVTPLSGSCTGSNFTVSVAVNPVPAVTAMTSTICSPGSFTVSPVNSTNGIVPAGTTYNWLTPIVTGGITGGGSGTSASSITGTLINPTNDLQTATYIVTPASGSCNGNPFTVTITINPEGSWTGVINSDWNNPGNWACNELPSLTTNVYITNGRPNYPTLSSEPVGSTKNLTIENNASVTVIGNTLQIGGTISNTGTFTASAGTIEMKGTISQNIGTNVFTSNTIMNLIINNSAGAVLQGPLNVTGIVTALNGNLISDGNLTLISTSGQSALIDGEGSGNVMGNVNMQLYLPAAFGYKYISSPLQTATVSEFATEVDLSAIFPIFYKYDENNSIDSSGVNIYTSGWVKYITLGSPLVPLSGYAANFGSNPAASPITANITGAVNNGNLQTALFNHNRKYTKGFNLVGNPYPSPIDWNAPGWSKTNIDNALYFFNASGSQYSGAYSSYVNGVSSGNADNIIAAMQGFFVHVTNGTYPVGATLGVSNSVRINNLSPIFKKALIDTRAILRFTASFEIKNPIEDAAVIYFDNMAATSFDKDKDALKLTNTDLLVPNLYTLTPELTQLQINGEPYPTDSISKIPIGITTFSDGWINFKANDISQLPPYLNIYLVDSETGKFRDLKQLPDYRFYLKIGEYNRRFTLVFSLSEFTEPIVNLGKMFTLSRSGDFLKVNVNLPYKTKGNLMITNILGQVILRKGVSENETVEINQSISSGVYVVSLISGKSSHSEKIIMRKDYE